MAVRDRRLEDPVGAMKRSLRPWLWQVPLDQEVGEELERHVELRTGDLVARGVDPKTAREMALARIGDMAGLKRTCVDLGRKRDREMGFTHWIDEFGKDGTFALRQLKAAPGFTLVTAITLALGIGANSAMFALADATLLRPLPFAEPDRLVMIWGRTPTSERGGVSFADMRDWGAQHHTLEALGGVALGAGGGPMLEGPDGSRQSVERQAVTTQFFDALGVTPVAGRTFQASDDGPTTSVVVLGEGLWRTRFGGDRTLIGRDVRLGGEPHTVIGVVADEIQLSRPNQIWTLIPQSSVVLTRRDARFLQVVARLKPGIAQEAAHADLTVIAEALARAHPETNKNVGVRIEPLRTGIMGRDLQLTSVFLLGTVVFVLLLCCANIASLMLARANARARELAVRTALGAGRARIVRQILTESLVLATLGGALGIALGAAILQAVPAVIPAGLPAALKLSFDTRVVMFSAAAALGAGVLFGLVPAWQATSTSLVQALAAESRSATRAGRMRNLLVAGEVAAAVLLLCGAGLLLRTLLVIDGFEQGYRADRDSVLTLDFSVPMGAGSRYPTNEALLQFFEGVQREVAAVPGIRDIGWSTSLPPTTAELGRWAVEIVGDAPLLAANRATAEFSVTSPGYFRTLDLPIVAGRGFTDYDTEDTTPVCIVNEAFVRRYLRGRDPIGVRIALSQTRPEAPPPLVKEIVGVARQVKGRPDEREEFIQVYVPLAQYPFGEVFMVVRSATGRPELFVPTIRDIVARRDPNLSVRRIRTLETLRDEATAGYQFRAVAVTSFAALAVVLAMVGVFGVLAYSVQQRSREFGVRMALGASMKNVLTLVAGSAAKLIGAGAAVGLILAAALARTLSAFLFGVQPLDPVSFIGAAMLLVVTASVAVVAPAIRAARVDPVRAIREQ
jgi:putative ABC transport system permease protein